MNGIGWIAAATLAAATLAADDDATGGKPVFGPAATELRGEALRQETVRAIDAGRDWLVANQNKDGSFGTHHTARGWEILATVPGSLEAFGYATSALCVMALDQSARPADTAAAAASHGVDFLIARHHIGRPNGMEFYNTWAFGYGLQALGEFGARHPDDPRMPQIRAACRAMLDRLPSYQILDGGFSYLDFDLQSIPPSDSEMSFTTATVLIGVARAERLGEKAPAGLVAKALERLALDQTPEGSFLYGRYLWQMPRRGINEPKGSACRTPGNLYALELFGKTPRRAVKWHEAIDNLVRKYVGFQQIAVRRPVPHEAWYNISGYFYLYGFYYAALALEEKLTAEQQAELYPWLARGVLYCRQPNGAFWDYPLYNYHDHYGTAFALLALSRAPKGWLETVMPEAVAEPVEEPATAPANDAAKAAADTTAGS